MSRPTRPQLPALPGWKALLLAWLLSPMAGWGMPSMLDIRLARMAQKQEHHELIRTLQPMLDRHQPLPSAQLMFLAVAYAETRNYARLFPVCDLWQAQIERGDNRMFGGELSAQPHFMRANALLDLGDPLQALGEAQAARAILARQDYAANNFMVSYGIETEAALGVAHALLHQPREAGEALRRLEALSLEGTINGPQKYTAIARVHVAMGRFDLALGALQDPRADAKSLASLFYDNTFQMLPLAFLRTKCLFETGRRDEARAGYDRLLAHPHLAELGGLHWPVLLDRARIAIQEGKDPLAEELLRKSVAVIERQRASIGTEAGRIGFVGDKQACYQELIALLVRTRRPGVAFEFVERAKGRSLVDLLASQKGLARGGRPALDQALVRLDQADQEQMSVPDPAAGAGKSRGIAVALRTDLLAQAPELASLVTVPETSAGAIQSRLAPDETLLEYYAAGSQWIAFVVTRDTLAAVPLQTPDLNGAVLRLRRALTDPGRADAGRPAIEALTRQLLDPVTPRIRTEKLIIVPHGILHYVPFCALGSSAAPVLDRYSLRLLPSATVLAYLKPGKPVENALILGNPDLGSRSLDLPFAQEEGAALARILPRPDLRLGREASAEQLRAGGRYSIIHLAAHGAFDEAHPLDSAIFLASTAGTPGTVRVSDLYRLDLDADLVTLSACETALSAVSSGDDLVGFTRGLLYAGSRSILSSLWKVDDECTRDLMVDFYTQLAGQGKPEALRHAQLAVRARHPHPYYWAAFMITGNAR